MDNQNLAVPEIKKEPLPSISTRDYVFLLLIFLASWFTAHASFKSLGAVFAISVPVLLTVSTMYLFGKLRFSALSYISLGATFVISISYLIHGDSLFFGFFKLVFLIFSGSVFFLSSCQFDRRRVDCLSVIFSPFFLVFKVGLPKSVGMACALVKKNTSASAKIGKIALALVCVFPLAAVLVVLLASSDAAFEGFVNSLNFESTEFTRTFIVAIITFLLMFPFLFAINKEMYKEKEKGELTKKGLDSVFICTVLFVVAIVYLFFIITQFSYIFNGFAGLLPKDYTYAEYARRGFGEMCVICVINFMLLAFCMAKTARDEKGNLPLVTRLLSVFISVFSNFLVVVAIAKMFMYIQNYGLTFLRLGTSIFMLFLFVVFLAVIIKIFRPEFSHIRVAVASACIIMGITAAVDPYNVITSFNTYAYQSGMHEDIDEYYLYYNCGDYGMQSIISLAEDDNVYLVQHIKELLSYKRNLKNYVEKVDIAEFSIANHAARKAFANYRADN